MRHGILASVAVLTLICLAVGDEPKRLDACRKPMKAESRGLLEQDRTDLDTEIEELQVKLEHLGKKNVVPKKPGRSKSSVEVRETIEDTERNSTNSRPSESGGGEGAVPTNSMSPANGSSTSASPPSISKRLECTTWPTN